VVQPDIETCLDETMRVVRDAVGDASASVGVVLGTGLGGFVDRMRKVTSLPCSTLPHVAIPLTRLNTGNVCLGVIDDVPVVCLQGRSHLYEGYPAWQVVHGVRLMVRLGVRAILLTDSCGALDPTWTPGMMMVVNDHIDFASESLVAPGPDGNFRPPSELMVPYDPLLARELHEAAHTETLLAARIGQPVEIALREGIYAGVRDASGLTVAQGRMLHAIGASAVGAGIVPEAVALARTSVRVAALTYVDYVAGARASRPSIGEETTGRVGPSLFERVVRAWVLRAHRAVATD